MTPSTTKTARKTAPGKPSFKPVRGRPTAAQAEAITASIVTATTDLLLALGYEATTMDAVAKRAGIPKSTLYKRYADKPALIRDVVQARLSAWGEASAGMQQALAGDIRSRLKQRLQMVLHWTANDEIQAFSRIAFGVGEGARIVAQVLQDVGRANVIDLLEADIRELGRPDGSPAQDPRFVATAIMTLLAGWIATQSPDLTVPPATTEEFAERAIDLIIHGAASW